MLNSCYSALLTVIVCGLISCTPAEIPGDRQGSRSVQSPNIIFILADDVGVGDINCYYPASQVQTPHIDQLAAEGMRFTQAYAPGSVCSPTRYALLSGFYPSRGPLRLAPARYSSPLAFGTDMLTLPRFLKQQGYRTAHIGKWHLGYGATGNTNWAGEIKPGPNEIGFDYQISLPTNHSDNFKTYVENHRLLWLKPEVTELFTMPTKEQLTQIRFDDEVDSTLTAKAIEFMQQNADQSFFIYLALVATHTHVTPHKDFRGTSQIGQYGDYLHELDHHVGQVMQALEDLNLTEQTIVIFASDNGGQENDVRNAGQNLNLRDDSMDVAEKAKTAKRVAREVYGHRTNGDLRGYKGGTFEGGFRVPFIVRWPGTVTAGVESEQVITHADMLATTAGLLGEVLPATAGGDSFDLSGVLLGEQPIDRTVILQSGSGELAFRDGDWKLRFSQAPKWDGEVPTLPAEHELYHLAEDPIESTDLSQAHPARVAAMRQQLLDLLIQGHSRQD